MSEFDIILGMDWLATYRVSIDFQELKATLSDEDGQEMYFYGERNEESINNLNN